MKDELKRGDQVQIINGPGAGNLGRVIDIERANSSGEAFPNPYLVQSEAFYRVFYSRNELRKVE